MSTRQRLIQNWLTRVFVERDNLTTFMVTHSMQQATKLANRMLIMHKCKIIDDIDKKEKRNFPLAPLSINLFTVVKRKN
jgi:putative ABC transport system ATP-binding protein